MTDLLKIAVLVSGSGSNLQSIIDQIDQGLLRASIKVVISNNPQAFALERARRHGIPHLAINHLDFASRVDFEAEISARLNPHAVDLIVLAGFMRVLSPGFIRTYPQRIINIHPALLPSFPGVNAQRQAWDYGVKFTGCTVHFVDEGVDTGPIIIQSVVPVYDGDSPESLSDRILREEHRILPQAIRLYASKKLVVQGSRVYIKDGKGHLLPSVQNPPPA